MKIADVLSPQLTQCNVAGSSKKRVLELLSTFIADSTDNNLDAETLYTRLLERERLGSTGIGDGVAIPHCRLTDHSSVIAAMIKLEHPIDYDAIDDKPVDLIFALLVPENECENHLQTLSSIAEVMMNPEAREALRQASTNDQLYQTLIALEKG